jgi:hypothetical protein
MATTLQVVSLRLRLGIDTKESPTLVDDNKFLAISNGVFDKGTLGTLHLRNGYQALPDSPGEAESLATFNQDELLQITEGGDLYSYHPGANTTWQAKGSLQSLDLSVNSIQTAANNSFISPDSATLNGITAYAWADPNGSIYCCAVNEASGSNIFSQTLYSSSSPATAAVGPRMIGDAATGTFVLLYADSAGILWFWIMDSLAPAHFTNPGSITGLVPGNPFDACLANGYLLLVAQVTGSPDSLAVWSIDVPSMAINTGPVALSSGFSQVNQVCCCPAWNLSGAQTAFIAASQPAADDIEGQSDLNYWLVKSPGLTISVSGSAETSEAFGTKALAAVRIPNTSSVVLLREQAPIPLTVNTGVTPTASSSPIFGSTISQSQIDSFVINASTATPYLGIAFGNLASQPWFAGGSEFNVLITNASQVQQTLFVSSGLPDGAFFQVIGSLDSAGPAPTALNAGGRLPLLQTLGSGDSAIAICTGNVLLDVSGKTQIQTAIGELEINQEDQPVPSVQLGKTLVTASGGLVYGYDGNRLVEQGFPLFPEVPAGYLASSFLQVVVDQQPALASGYVAREIFRIVVPDNPITPGDPIGAFIQPSETVTFGGDSCAIYFSVNGSDNPSWTQSFSAWAEVVTLPTDTALSLAKKIYGAVQANFVTAGYCYATAPTAISYSNGDLGYTGYAVQIALPPQNLPISGPAHAELSALAIQQTDRGYGYEHGQAFSVACCPSNLIQPGQFFTFWVWNPTATTADASTGVPQPYAVWFTVNGIGTAPSLVSSGGAKGIKVAVTASPASWHTAEDVAYSVYDALGAALPSGTSGGGNLYGLDLQIAGPVVTVASAYAGLTGTPTALDPLGTQDASNPQLTGVGTSGLGAPVGGIIGTNVTTALSYDYVQTFEWTDNQSQINRSALSVPLTVTVPVFASSLDTINTLSAISPTPSSGQVTTGNLTNSPWSVSPSDFQGTLETPVAPGTVQIYNSTDNQLMVTDNGSGGFSGTYTSTSFPNGVALSGTISYTTGALNIIFTGTIVGTNVTAKYKTITASSVAVTPESQVFTEGDTYTINPAGTDSETVTVSETATGTITATFVNAHIAGEALIPQDVGGVFWTNYPWDASSPDLLTGVWPVNAVVQVQPSPLAYTMKQGTISALYRTQANGEVFFEVTPILASGFQGQVSATAPTGFFDLTSDSSLTGLLSLYTNGGAVENDGPPSASLVLNHQDRIFLAGLPDDPNIVEFSTPWTPNTGINFSDQQRLYIPPNLGTQTGGPVVGLASQDGNLLAFEQDQIWFVAGAGPDATGNGSFAPPQIITSPVGCRDPGSIVSYQGGTIFKSSQGFWLVDRQQQVSYIGAPVSAYNADVVTAATLIPEFQQIRFLSETGTSLVYDYLYNQWGPFTDHQGTAATTFQGLYTYANSGGSVFQEAQGVYSDAGGGYALSWQTAWIKFTGNVQGYNNIQRFILKGYFPGTQAHQIQVAYDYGQNTQVDTFVFNAAALGSGLWGSDPQWGKSVWGGGSGAALPDTYQIQVWPSNTLCESMQITYTLLGPLPVVKTPWIDAIDFEVGIRRGAYKGLGPGVSVG